MQALIGHVRGAAPSLPLPAELPGCHLQLPERSEPAMAKPCSAPAFPVKGENGGFQPDKTDLFLPIAPHRAAHKYLTHTY